MKKAILLLALCLSLATPIFADDSQTNDYSIIKGDFKIICLGDTKEIVKDKINYLLERKEISKRFLGYGTEILGKYAYIFFYYDNNKLYKILFYFTNRYYGGQYFTELKSFHEQVKSMFVELYGQPTTENDYPKNVGKEISITNEWRLDKKNIVLGIINSGWGSFYRNTYATNFYIIDSHMVGQVSNQKSEEQEKQIEDSKKDF